MQGNRENTKANCYWSIFPISCDCDPGTFHMNELSRDPNSQRGIRNYLINKMRSNSLYSFARAISDLLDDSIKLHKPHCVLGIYSREKLIITIGMTPVVITYHPDHWGVV